MANEQHVSLLKQGSAVWNEWYDENVDTDDPADVIGADLSGADLSGADLSEADLGGVNLTDANLSQARLQGTNLRGAMLELARMDKANLSRATLVHAKLNGADLRGASLQNADLNGADLSRADLSSAWLQQADLSGASLHNANLCGAHLLGADISGADFSEANLGAANVTQVRWDPARMRGKFRGVRGVDSCYGDALFRRAAADQDFLDTLEFHWLGTWRMWLFRVWGWLDYGRSMSRVAVFGFGLMACYGAIYSIDQGLLDYTNSAHTWFTPFYFSIVTFTTLGFGDVRPRGIPGEVLASSEVIIGYVTLGLLLAVLAEKLARRS